MSDCVATIISRETNWLKWKENKAQSFEKPLSEFVTSKKKRDQKHMNKLLGTHPILIQAGSKDVNYAKRGAKMRKYIKAPKEQINLDAPSVKGNVNNRIYPSMNILIKGIEEPCLADLLNPVLIDIDPD